VAGAAPAGNDGARNPCARAEAIFVLWGGRSQERLNGTAIAPALFMLNLMRKPCGLLFSAALFGCGGGSDGSSSLATSGAGEPGSERVSLPPDPGAAPTPEVLDLSAPDTDLREAVPGPEATPASGTPVPSRCLPPAGVSGSPRNVEQAVLLMNSLPRPTTLECFIESLDRPLELYLTSSNLSLQPADGARSPRTFIVQGALVLSVVGNREFSSLLEIGYQVVGVLNAQRDAGESVADRVSPAGTAVH